MAVTGLKPRRWQDWPRLQTLGRVRAVGVSSLSRRPHSLVRLLRPPFNRASDTVSPLPGWLISIFSSSCSLSSSLSCDQPAHRFWWLGQGLLWGPLFYRPTTVFLRLLPIYSLLLWKLWVQNCLYFCLPHNTLLVCAITSSLVVLPERVIHLDDQGFIPSHLTFGSGVQVTATMITPPFGQQA